MKDYYEKQMAVFINKWEAVEESGEEKEAKKYMDEYLNYNKLLEELNNK